MNVNNQRTMTHWLCYLSLSLSLAGCQHVQNLPAAPRPENIRIEENQKQLQASTHWRTVAEDMSTQLMETLKKSPQKKRPVFIYCQNKPSPFSRAFNDFLITSLVKHGVAVSTQQNGSRVFNYKLQLVEYNSLRSTILTEEVKFTSLASGLLVLRGINSLLGQDAFTLASGAALDGALMNVAPNNELLVTTSLVEDQIYISRSSDIYYINALDKHLYLPHGHLRPGDVFNEPFYQLK